ncbi:hypothetical protein GOBAR_AA10121 [Gossypium barbadense]|uniref:Uncharacterized protein n=1 Tax=Gossypium barbadense TaxID=3634 RepID=A0A2P5Y4N5_GOSBA|nr:hypothetical protein GOBAR_AA10121 [Gossypium barbadense]
MLQEDSGSGSLLLVACGGHEAQFCATAPRPILACRMTRPPDQQPGFMRGPQPVSQQSPGSPVSNFVGGSTAAPEVPWTTKPRARVFDIDDFQNIGLPRIPNFRASDFSDSSQYDSSFGSVAPYVPTQIATYVLIVRLFPSNPPTSPVYSSLTPDVSLSNPVSDSASDSVGAHFVGTQSGSDSPLISGPSGAADLGDSRDSPSASPLSSFPLMTPQVPCDNNTHINRAKT